MTEFSLHDKQECFIQESFDYIDYQNINLSLPHQLPFNLYKQLPPNELRSIARPQSLAPRTLNANKHMSLLPNILNKSCNEVQTISKPGLNRLKIANKEKVSIEEFFSKKQYRQVYNRLNHFPSESKNFSGKLLSVDSVADYNHKMFRELEKETNEAKSLLQDAIDADFQSGNLCKAFVCNSEPNEYFLVIENDTNTYGYNFWFFFRFRNIKKGIRTFHLVNMSKKTDNYKKGFQISIFSQSKNKKNQTMWFKGGEKITFGQTNFTRLFHLTERYCSLSFQYQFEEDQDEVYFSMNQPYTYSRMSHYISQLQKAAQKSQIKVEVKRLGHTLADNVIPSVRIWSGTSQNKETILFTARQHPCETVSSFVCEGMINQIIQGTPQVKLLLQKYQLFIVPMVNPDGVIHGSSRCNLAGFDLNRQWSQFLIKEFTPQTHRIKKYLTQIHKQNPIKYFFDLHGHGKKLNSFVFSCKKGDNPSSRLIQLVMNKVEPRFNILDCTYGIDRQKESTLRSQLHHMGVNHCYTLETSLMGYVTPEGQAKQFTEQDLFSIGASVLKGIFTLDRPSDIVLKVLGFTKEQLLQNSQSVIAKICQKQKDDSKKIIQDDNASDSDPQGDNLDFNERLEKCCKHNVNLKKKITDTIKKEKGKKKKSSLKVLAKKEERKNSSNSSNQQAQKMLSAVKLQNSVQKASSKPQTQLSLSQQQKSMNKISINNKRTTVYSKKVKQKKQSLKHEVKTLRAQNQFLIKNSKRHQSLNSTEIKFRNHKLKKQIMKTHQNTSKTSCSIIYEYPNEGMLSTMKKLSRRMKTEGNVDSSKNIPGIFYHEPEPKQQAKYSELRDESLKALLTDTFSVLKVKPKLSIKRYVKPITYDRNKRARTLTQDKEAQHIGSLPMKRADLSSNKRMKTYSHVENVNFSQRSEKNKLSWQLRKNDYTNSKYAGTDFKYKRFQSFMYNGITTANTDRQNSSVFYYFPVL